MALKRACKNVSDGINPDLVMSAKMAEMQQLRDRAAFTICSRSEVGVDTKLVGTRCVLVNKGTQSLAILKHDVDQLLPATNLTDCCHWKSQRESK